MAIEHTCRCGARIRLPDRAAGRRARCTSCGAIFKVAEAAIPVAKPAAGPEPAANVEEEGDSLEDLLPDLQKKRFQPHEGPGEERLGMRRGESEVEKLSFWEDAAWSFIFFRNGNNLGVLIVVSLVQLGLMGLQYVPFLGMVASLLSLIFMMWLVAFYFSVVLETAQGQDELSTIGFSDIIEDLVRPALRFLGCALIALGPAGLVALSALWNDQDIPWYTVGPLAAVGLFFWPVLILGSAIGGGLPIRSLHLLVLTVAKTPLAYLSVCVLVGMAAVGAIASSMGMSGLLTKFFGGNVPMSLAIAYVVVGEVVETYAWIVAMRLIGLYYRHFKSHFPWRAE